MIKSATLTVPATASTTTREGGKALDGLGAFDSLLIVATLVSCTGGTLDVYLQVASDNEDTPTWVDYAHFAQIAGAASTVTKAISVSRHAQQLTATTVGVGDTPALAANTFLGGDFGERMRIVAVTGAGVSAGCDITVRVIGSAPKRRV